MAGSAIAGQVLSPAGFAFQVTATGRPSGGAFATGPLRGFRDGDHEEFQRARDAAAEWLRTKPRLP